MTGRLPAAVLMGFLSLAAAEVDEYSVKAAFLYNFAKFVEWPPEAFRGPADPIRICVLGQNPFGVKLRDTVGGKVVAGRSFEVNQIPNVSQAAPCHIIFVSSSERERLAPIIAELKESSALVVGDTRDFAAQGGDFNLKVESDMIRIEVNLAGARKKNLKISAKLLGLARIVSEEHARP